MQCGCQNVMRAEDGKLQSHLEWPNIHLQYKGRTASSSSYHVQSLVKRGILHEKLQQTQQLEASKPRSSNCQSPASYFRLNARIYIKEK